MPKSKSNDADDHSGASNANIADDILIRQENQSLPPKELKLPGPFLEKQARIVDWISISTTISLIMATTVAFCCTKSWLSFSFLPIIPYSLSIRRRKEEALFPISQEDLQIRLKELDVEIEKVRQQNSSVILPFFKWLKRIFSK